MSRKAQVIVKARNPRAERLKVKAVYGWQAKYDARTTELLAMLRTKRPHGSQAEKSWVEQWIAPLGTEPDFFGNHWMTIGSSPIIWSSHTDTVHAKGGVQFVGFNDGCAYVMGSDCLGADDTTGCWIMRNMIQAGIPGTYIFHRGEEVGGLGSSFIRDYHADRLEGKSFAIAFDRKGYGDIITDQCGNTASVKFATSMATALGDLPYHDEDGVFTDTANYADLIPECSNISVGYHDAHSGTEWQDVDFAMLLLNQILRADFSKLVAARDPAERFLEWDDRCDATWHRRHDGLGHGPEFEWRCQSTMSLDDICRRYPEHVSDFLAQCGYDERDLLQYLGITA